MIVLQLLSLAALALRSAATAKQTGSAELALRVTDDASTSTTVVAGVERALLQVRLR